MSVSNLADLSIPNMSEQDKALLKQRQADLLRSREDIVSQGMGNVANTASIGSGPVNPNNAAVNAIRARSAQKFNADLNDIMQKQQYASYGKRAKNVATAFDEASSDYESLMKKNAAINDLASKRDQLKIDELGLDFQEILDAKYERLTQLNQRIMIDTDIENKRRKAEEAKNAILKGILSSVGMIGGAVAGGLMGGPVGAGVGAGVGSQSGNLATGYDPTSAPRRGGY